MANSDISRDADYSDAPVRQQALVPVGDLLSKNGAAIGLAVLLTVAGAFLPTTMTDVGFNGFVSSATVAVESPRGRAGELSLLMSVARENLLSTSSLNYFSTDLTLGKADLIGVHEQSTWGVILELLTGRGPAVADMLGVVETALGKSLFIDADPASGTMEVKVIAATPRAAQRIADHVSLRLVDDFGSNHLTPEMRAAEDARSVLDKAEAALTGFQMRNGNAVVSRMQNLQQRLQEADAAFSSLEKRDAELRDMIAKTAGMKAEDVFRKPLPAGPAFLLLEDIRQNHSAADLVLAEVSVDHGPKHPKTIAAQSAVNSARAAAVPALRRVLDSLRHEETQLAEAIAVSAEDKSALVNQLKAMGDGPAELARLETALEDARQKFLVASRLTPNLASEPSERAFIKKKANPGVGSYDMVVSTTMTISGALAGLLTSLLVLSFRRKETTEHADSFESDESVNLTPVLVEDDSRIDSIPEFEPAIFYDLEEPVIGATPTIPVDEIVEAPADEIETLHDEPANDIPLDQRVRQVLMRNMARLDRDESELPVFKLPPLLEAALAGQAIHAQAETEELKALRQELALLRERLAEQADFEEEYRSQA